MKDLLPQFVRMVAHLYRFLSRCRFICILHGFSNWSRIAKKIQVPCIKHSQPAKKYISDTLRHVTLANCQPDEKYVPDINMNVLAEVENLLTDSQPVENAEDSTQSITDTPLVISFDTFPQVYQTVKNQKDTIQEIVQAPPQAEVENMHEIFKPDLDQKQIAPRVSKTPPPAQEKVFWDIWAIEFETEEIGMQHYRQKHYNKYTYRCIVCKKPVTIKTLRQHYQDFHLKVQKIDGLFWKETIQNDTNLNNVMTLTNHNDHHQNKGDDNLISSAANGQKDGKFKNSKNTFTKRENKVDKNSTPYSKYLINPTSTNAINTQSVTSTENSASFDQTGEHQLSLKTVKGKPELIVMQPEVISDKNPSMPIPRPNPVLYPKIPIIQEDTVDLKTRKPHS